jgi:multidrug resistance efflux pump
VRVHPGDRIEAGKTVLATLDDGVLRMSLATEQAQRESFLKEADAARAAQRIAEVQIAEARARAAAARIGLLQSRIDQAEIRAPIDGVVLVGQLDRLVGAPVRAGDTLFEVAPGGAMSARVAVPEHRVPNIEVGQPGEIAAAAYPSRRIACVVERVAAAAEVMDGRNVFHADVTLSDSPAWLRPGMEGEARLVVGRASYARLWTRDLVNWLRMRLWL